MGELARVCAMSAELDLPAERGGLRLRIESQPPRWCLCYLMPEARLLGGYSTDYVLGHLRQAIENPAANPVGEMDGRPISWVMSLASPHSSLYTTMLADRQHLFLADANGSRFAELNLGPEQRRQWIATLEAAAGAI
jgi:hypothetical protein